MVNFKGQWLNWELNDVEALLLRCQRKGHVLRYDGEDRIARNYTTKGPDNKKKEVHTQGFMPRIKIFQTKKAREKGLELSPSDKKQIEDHIPQLAHVLRDDDDFRRELVRSARRKIAEIYPLGTGCDLTESYRYFQRADEAAAAGKPFEFMVLLIAATQKAYTLCEEYRGHPLRYATSEEKRETSIPFSRKSAKPKSQDLRERVAAAEAATQESFGH